MAYGGGTFSAQNKTLPGAYINFSSVSSKVNALFGARGTVAVALPVATPNGEVLEWTYSDFKENCKSVFGCEWNTTNTNIEEDIYLWCVIALREIFCTASKVVISGLLNSIETKYSTATTEYYLVTSTIKGDYNGYIIVEEVGPDSEGCYLTITLKDPDDKTIVTVTAQGETLDKVKPVCREVLNAKQDLFIFADDGGFDMSVGGITDVTTKTYETAGGVGASVTSSNAKEFHSNSLNELAKKTFNILACVPFDNTDTALETSKEIRDAYNTFTKKYRDEYGVKFQTVYYDYLTDSEGNAVNYEACVSLNATNNKNLIFWTAGLLAGTSFARSACNATYTGELGNFISNLGCDVSAEELETAITGGSFTFHTVGDEIRVLDDINTYIEDTSTDLIKDVDIFNDNQSIRVIDQIANDVATIFVNNYLGKVPDDEAGRNSFWDEVVSYLNQMNSLGGIMDFVSSNVTVEAGEKPRSVLVSAYITVGRALKKLYMQVTVG